MTAVIGEEGEKRYTVQQGENRYRGEVKKQARKCFASRRQARQDVCVQGAHVNKEKGAFFFGGGGGCGLTHIQARVEDTRILDGWDGP